MKSNHTYAVAWCKARGQVVFLTGGICDKEDVNCPEDCASRIEKRR